MKKNNNLSLVIANSAPDVIQVLKGELAQLKTITESQYKTGTSGKITGFPNAIQDETSVETLVKMHSSVNGRRNAYDNSLNILSSLSGGTLSVPLFKENGNSFENIEADIALRIQVLSVSARKQTLENLLKEAETFMTEKDKFAAFLERAGQAVGKS